MNDFYNLEKYISLDQFPWMETYTGIARSTKNASIFYGIDNIESDELGLNAHKEFLTLNKEQQAWYKSVAYGRRLKGVDILLTEPKSWPGSWYKLDEVGFWRHNSNAAYFPNLFRWINTTEVFDGTGRIIFFIQFQGSKTPAHIDENIANIPENYSKIREFIWLTPPDNPKRLLINGIRAGNITWFNSYVKHETLEESNIRWSLRIDGKFSRKFKKMIGII